LVLVNGKKFELTRTRTRNSNSTILNPRDVSTRSSSQPEFNRGQVASRQTDRAVGPGASSKLYLSYSQGVGPATVARSDVVSYGGYGARPKTTGSARQMEPAWTEAGPTVLPPGSGIPSQNSSTAEGGQAQPVNLGQPGPLSVVHACPQARVDVPIGSTPVQSPVIYKDPSTGQWVLGPSNAASLSSFNSIPKARIDGFIAEARGTCQSAKVVDVSQCVSGTSGPPPAQPMQAQDASVSGKSSKSLLKLQCYDGSGSLETFLVKLQHLAAYMKWNKDDWFHHLCTSLEGPAGQVLWELPHNATTADLERLLQTWFGTELQAESFRAELCTRR